MDVLEGSGFESGRSKRLLSSPKRPDVPIIDPVSYSKGADVLAR